MDILLIDPPYRCLKGVGTRIGYHIGLTYLASYLQREGFDAKVITGDALLYNKPPVTRLLNQKKYAKGQRDYERIVKDSNHDIWKEIERIIRQYKPKAVGITYVTPAKFVVEKVAEIAKKVNRDIITIAGGHHPTSCPDDVMKNPDMDFAVRGEGEMPLSSLMKELNKAEPDFSKVKGIHYRDQNGNIIGNEKSPLIAKMDDLPIPDRDLVIELDYSKFKKHIVSTTRGCPALCSFCADKPMWGGKVRQRSPESVIEELRMIKTKFPMTTELTFVDGTFTFNRKFVKKICQLMIKENFNIMWDCMVRYNTVDEALLSLMKQAGCYAIYLGVESGSERVLKMISKGIDLSTILEQSKMIRKSGIISMAAFMLGIPGETNEDMMQTLDLMRKIKNDVIDLCSFIPLPGTNLYDLLPAEEKENIDWLRSSTKSFDNYFNKNVTREELKNALAEAHKIVKNKQRVTILRQGFNFGMTYLKQNLAIPGKILSLKQNNA